MEVETKSLILKRHVIYYILERRFTITFPLKITTKIRWDITATCPNDSLGQYFQRCVVDFVESVFNLSY